MAFLKELVTIEKGKKVTPSEEVTEKSIRYIQIGDLRTNKNYQYCEVDASYKIANQDDIIIAWDGANAGQSSYGLEGAIGSTLALLKRKSNDYYTPFLGIYINSKFDYFQNNSTGATIPHLSRVSLDNLHIPLPPLDIQKKIADTLDKAQELIDKRKEQISALDKFLENLFLEMFGDPVSNPMGWEKVPVKIFGSVITGNTPPRAEEGNYGNYLEWIKSDNINTPFTYLTKASEYLSEEGAKKGRIVEKGSVLITCIAGSLSCIGNIAITDRKVSFNQQINAIVPNTKKITIYFLYNLILNTKKYIQDSSTKGMKGMISKGVFENLEFILPPLDLQNQFASIVEKVEAEKTKLEASLKEMEDNFNSIMQRAFKGELF